MERLFKHLLDNKANVNVIGTARKASPLHFLTERMKKEEILVLLENGCDINIVDGWGATPLFWAVADNSDAIIDLLLEHKAKTNIRDHRGRTALYIAAYNKRLRSATILLQHGADPNVSSKDSLHTPLHWAVVNRDVKMVDVLLRHGAVQTKDKAGDTPIDWLKDSPFDLTYKDKIMYLLKKKKKNPTNIKEFKEYLLRENIDIKKLGDAIGYFGYDQKLNSTEYFMKSGSPVFALALFYFLKGNCIIWKISDEETDGLSYVIEYKNTFWNIKGNNFNKNDVESYITAIGTLKWVQIDKDELKDKIESENELLGVVKKLKSYYKKS